MHLITFKCCSSWVSDDFKRPGRHNIDRFHDNRAWNIVHVAVHAFFVFVLVPTGL